MSLILSGVGIAFVIVGLACAVFAGGVPYHDGPNAGHLSAPGYGRLLESAGEFCVKVGMVLAPIGLVGAALIGLWNALRTVWIQLRTPRR